MVQVMRFASLALISTASAHFLLPYPNSAGFDDDNEGIAPCGGFAVTYDNATDFHVDGDSIALVSTHPTADWLIRATLDQTAFSGYQNLLPSFVQTGLGAFCETGVKVNSSWAGQKGVIQVVQDATDGFLYQCAPVNFVSGTASSIPSVCTNATGASAAYTAVTALSSVPAATASAAGESSSVSATATASSSTAGAEPTAYSMNGVFWAAAGVMGAAVIGGL